MEGNTISKLDALVPSKLEAECLGEMILFHYPAAVVTQAHRKRSGWADRVQCTHVKHQNFGGNGGRRMVSSKSAWATQEVRHWVVWWDSTLNKETGFGEKAQQLWASTACRGQEPALAWTTQAQTHTQFKIIKIWGWRKGSTVESTCCSWREPRFGFQHPHCDSQASITPVPGELVPLLTSVGTRSHMVHINTKRPNTYAHKIHEKKIKIHRCASAHF